MTTALNLPPGQSLGQTLAEGLAGRYMRELDSYANRLIDRAWAVPMSERPGRYLRSIERALRSYPLPWTLDLSISGKRRSRALLATFWGLDDDELRAKALRLDAHGMGVYPLPVRITKHALGRLLQTYRPETWEELIVVLKDVAITALDAITEGNWVKNFRSYIRDETDPTVADVYVFEGVRGPRGGQQYRLKTAIAEIREGQGTKGYLLQRMRNRGLSSMLSKDGENWEPAEVLAVA